jgi:acetyltransferase-like isoleucine patch superfamily enzyme
MITNREDLLKCIDAEEVILGDNVRFGDNVQIASIGGRANRVEIGDNVFIGNNVMILVPEFSMGDFTTIHQSCRISGYEPVTIGHNFWCDQNCILNSTARLKIGNNVGIGAYSQLWTHIKFGDTLIGNRFDSAQPMTIHDDVWFVGHCMVSPIEAGARSMVMLGSTVTKDLAENRIYAGTPARDLTDRLGAPYTETSIDDRAHELRRRIADFFEMNKQWDQKLIEVIDSWDRELDSTVTYFNVKDRTYSKRRNPIETDVMRHLLPTAKFLPRVKDL